MQYKVEEASLVGKTTRGQDYYKVKIKNVENNEIIEDVYMFKPVTANDIITGEVITTNKNGRIFKKFKFENPIENINENFKKLYKEIENIQQEIASMKQFLSDIFKSMK